jgi:hypothetical protein
MSGGYKELQRREWSGQKIDETRTAAIALLMNCLEASDKG